MHPSMTNIGAYLRTKGASNTVQGYSPEALAAGTTYGDAFDVTDARSCVLTGQLGAATGTPTTQSVVLSLESALPSGSDWVAVADSTITLDTDETSKEVDVNLMGLTSGHTRLRVKAVVSFTGGTSPKALVAACVPLAGFARLPA